MNILVIFTGGTIGSAVKNGWISPTGEAKRELIAAYEASGNNDVSFSICEPYSILSENLSAEKLNILVRSVCESLDSGYDGIIVTHGTDTLQYSAAVLDLAVGADSIPVMLVSSNYPLSDSRANGHANFAAAVEFIKKGAGQGVFISYRNKDGSVYFYRGGETVGHREMDDEVFGFEGRYYARITNGNLEILGDKSCVRGLGAFVLETDPEILVIDVYPGAAYRYCLDGYRAVVLKPYHSGTLDTANEGFRRFCTAATERGIPIFAVNVKGGVTYESSKEFDTLGIIPSYTSFAKAYMRLWVAISRGETLAELRLDCD